jgi:hypothetical protein
MYFALRSTLTAGVALAGAGAIAMSPISPVAPQLPDATIAMSHASSAAVELTALADPITAWAEVFGTAFNNVSQIGGDIAAAPFPILQQVISNQMANGQLLATSIDAAATSYIRFFTSAEDYQLGYWVREAANNLASGNVSAAATNLSTVVFRLFAFANPLINIMQIPIGTSQNLVNAFAAVPQMLMPLGLSVLNPIEGVINASGDIAQNVLNAVNNGDPVAALTAVVNAPAVLTGAILNGYYSEYNGAGTTGIFTTGESILNRGLIQTLLVTIPQTIATAIGWRAPAVEAAFAKALPAVQDRAISSITDISAGTANAVKTITLSLGRTSKAPEKTTAGGASKADSAGADDDSTAASNPAADHGFKAKARTRANTSVPETEQGAKAERQQTKHETKATTHDTKAATHDTKSSNSRGAKHRAAGHSE